MANHQGKDELKNKIMEFLKNSEEESVGTRSLLQLLGARENSYYQALDSLKQQGKITVSRSRRVRLTKPARPAARHHHRGAPKTAPVSAQKTEEKKAGKKKTVTAKIVSLSRGFAFARPEDGGDDLFIHGDRLKSAFLGDTVELGHVRQSDRGPSAEVDEITEKSERVITGTLVRDGVVCEIIPDGAIRYNIPVERGGAMGAENGDKVQAEVRRLYRTEALGAQVIKIYGRADSAKICSDAIIDRHGIVTEFPEEVLREAERAASREITEKDRRERLDLSDLSICTIDSADAKDLDDAISVSKTRDGGYKLGVHIADVSHYVREGTALDAHALERGTSVYFADRVIPMLPETLSNGVCSLNAGMEKLAFSALIRLDAQGELVSYEFRKSIIVSKVRGVYSEVNALFRGTADKELKKKYHPVIRSLNAARELAGVLKERSKRMGTVDLESSESKFTLNENGVCIDVQPRTSGESEQMIEQLMIAANQAAARLAREKNLPFVYRIHELPAPDRVDSLAELVSALGLSAKSLTHSGDVRTADFAAIMEQAAGTPAQKVVSHQLLRTMAKARYDTQPVGHFGLALRDYCHFTSPIRRYPDTAVHRILSALSSGEDVRDITRRYADFVKEAASGSSRCEVRAMQAERSAEDCYMAEYMTQHIGECYDGVISGVTMRGVFVELPNTVEGFVPITGFVGAHFQFDGVVTQYDRLTGQKLTIGQPLRVKAVSADVASGRIDFIPVQEE